MNFAHKEIIFAWEKWLQPKGLRLIALCDINQFSV